MTPSFMINLSGLSVPIYDGFGQNVIGELVNREAYVISGHEGSVFGVLFLKPDGSFGGGLLKDTPDGVLTECIEKPWGTAEINGRIYYTFIMRSQQPVYTAGGTRWGSVAATQRVACLDATAGYNNPWYKLINYVESTDGEWVQVTGDGADYGFVDTGIRSASSFNKIAMYGSW